MFALFVCFCCLGLFVCFSFFFFFPLRKITGHRSRMSWDLQHTPLYHEVSIFSLLRRSRVLVCVPNTNTNFPGLSTLNFSMLHTVHFLARFVVMLYLVLPGAKKGNKLLSWSPMDWTRTNGIKLH